MGEEWYEDEAGKYVFRTRPACWANVSPPSTMPLSLASQCSKKYKVEQVVGVEDIGEFAKYLNNPKKWHWLIIGDKI